MVNIADYIFLDGIFQPLKYVNLGTVYSEYSSIIDFFIYLVFFLGIVRVAFERHFKGRGGKFVIASIGCALAFSMTYAEKTMGFDLRQLGSLGILIFVFVLALMIYNIMKGLGMGYGMAGGVIFFYIALNALSPSVFKRITTALPLINLVFILSMILIFFMLFKGLAHSFGSEGGLRSEILSENRLVKKGLERLTKKARNRSIKTGKGLKKVEKDMRSGDLDAVSKELQDLKKESGAQEIQELLKRIRELDYRLQELDVDAMKELKKKHGEVPEYDRQRIAGIIKIQRDKLKMDEQIKAFEKFCRDHVSGFENAISKVESAIKQSNKEMASEFLDEAIERNKNIRGLLHEMQAVEERLLELNKIELKDMG